jgi:3-dehydroquinate dehydratase/shikimate dehydrogenase
MIVVPSLLPRSADEAARFLRSLARRGSLVELRIDGFRRPDPAALLSGPRPPVIVTCRRAKEGGRFTGTAREAASLLERALAAGAEFVDAEFSLGSSILRRLFDEGGRGRIILSFHDPGRTPPGLLARFRRMAAMRPAVIKIAVASRAFSDTGKVLELLDEARRTRKAAVAISMGEFGAYTRILQGHLGGTMTFAAYEPARPTAPGQASFAEMTRIYGTARLERLDRRTKVFGLLGNPVSLSRGISVHNAAFRRNGANAVYVNFAADDAGDFMRIFGPRVSGLSVTMPFKSEIARHLDTLEGSSVLTGSVNTVVRKGGKLTGLNTDFHAFVDLLRRRTAIAGKRLVVLGTGATAATVAGAATLYGARVTIAGRNSSRARRLAERFGAEWVPISGLAPAAGEILVNATSVGMTPRAGRVRGERIVPASALRGYSVVCDFANPPGSSTVLVDDAAARGLAVITGGEIFRAQARLQSVLFLEAVRS